MPAANFGICKSRAVGSRVSTFCFSTWLHIGQEVNNLAICKSSTFIYKFSSGSQVDGSLSPSFGKYLPVGGYSMTDSTKQ
jgi:hypothetical protein